MSETEVPEVRLSETQVLIVGAGPTGLVLALWLAKSGVRVRIIDQSDGPGTTSRAIVVHARTLEYYQQLGIADAAVAGGISFSNANLWVGGQRVAGVRLGDIGAGLSAYPYVLIFPQDQHEQMLVAELERVGVQVERLTTLVGFDTEASGVRARLRTASGVDAVCEAHYLAGCDGARSAVRNTLAIGFPGGTYADLFYVADLEASGPVANGEMHGALDDTDFLAVFPMRGGGGRVRLVGAVTAAARLQAGDAATLRWDDVHGRVVERLGVRVREVHWFSTYHVHHRVADAFRRGRAFLVGDAAHIHSPVGGQGMNTGIGDAVNLAWKLAAVLHGRADAAVLDSYEAERIGFARTLVATTDRAFKFVTSRGALARHARLRLAPSLLPTLFQFDALRRLMFRRISQTAIAYPRSPLSTGSAGQVAAGDRLPWVAVDRHAEGARDNFAPLASRDWQVHVYGDVGPAVRSACEARGLKLHVFPWRPAMPRAGLRTDATYLIRPDGHVGFAEPTGDAAPLTRYLDAHGIRPGV